MSVQLTTPHNFQNSNKWFNSIGRPNRYSDFVTSKLKPYVNTQTTPPYQQGSYSIFSTTQQNKANYFNLRNGIGSGPSISSTANVNLASPLPKPGRVRYAIICLYSAIFIILLTCRLDHRLIF